MKTGDCSEEEEKKAKELLSDEVIKSLVYKIEMNIREEKEMEKMMKENSFGFYGNMKFSSSLMVDIYYGILAQAIIYLP